MGTLGTFPPGPELPPELKGPLPQALCWALELFPADRPSSLRSLPRAPAEPPLPALLLQLCRHC